MTGNRKNCTPEFVFEKVHTQPYAIIYLAFTISLVPAVLFYWFLIQRFFAHGGLALSFGILILGMSLIMQALSKTVRIYFDEKSIFIGDASGNFTRYLKRDIAGICAYDYELKSRPNVSVTIALKNGKMIHLNDINLFSRSDPDKAQMLKRFFSTAKKRLDLTFVKKDRLRAWQGTGANWYAPSKAQVCNDRWRHETGN